MANRRYKLTTNTSSVVNQERRESAVKALKIAKAQDKPVVIIRRSAKTF